MKKSLFLLLFCVFSQFAFGQIHLKFQENEQGKTTYILIKNHVYSSTSFLKALDELDVHFEEKSVDELTGVRRIVQEKTLLYMDEYIDRDNCYELTLIRLINVINLWLKKNNS